MSYSTEILTFSGRHPFRRQCGGAAQRRIADLLAKGLCPRCEHTLVPADAAERATYRRPGDATPTWRPAGSRATRCRCIPVCELCGHTEGHVNVSRDALDEIDRADDLPAEIADDERAAVAYLAISSRTSPRNWPIDRERESVGVAVVRLLAEQYGTATMYDTVEEMAGLELEADQTGGWSDPN